MEIIRKRAYARAGLIGNPSDGYHGKTIAFTIRQFFAEVTLYDWPKVEIVQSVDDQSSFRSIKDLFDDVRLHGYYGGVRLIKATIKRFYEYCDEKQLELHDRNFSIRYSTTIPRAVGMAGSSAIIVATLRALMEFYNIDVPQHVQPSLALSVETRELGIAAGLQDRVVQIYEGLVSMDFATDVMTVEDGMECGRYEGLSSENLKNVYVAFSLEAGEPTYVVHNPLRARYQAGDPDVLQAMETFANLTVQAKSAIEKGDTAQLHELIDRNFDTRASICSISPSQRLMIETARGVGASAKFAGSGGAIVGTFSDQQMFNDLKAALLKIHCETIQPQMNV
ncbi:GHMP kinase [Thalassoglobus sp. JC818]|uniref:mevalonate kinase family protein n=1 Tax=Thalassoglobus sp. JC818 TaxID=3232136 RepID=UPI00345A812F